MLKLLSFTILWYILWRRNEDNLRVRDNNCTRYFNPRSPCGERHRRHSHMAPGIPNFNPRSPCGERLLSVPAFRRGGLNFNPRSPCGERPQRTAPRRSRPRFQSTLPVRGATLRQMILTDSVIYISIHAPRAGSDQPIIAISV